MPQSKLPDERDLFRRLDHDAHRAALPEPEALRRRSDRRTAVRAAVGTVAVVVAVLAVIAGVNGLTVSAAPDPVGDPTSTPTPSVSSLAPPEAIPASAWLDKGDLGFESAPVEEVDPPVLCGMPLVAPQTIRSGAVSASGSRTGSYHSPGTPEVNTPDGTIVQTILLAGDEAVMTDLMADIEALVAGCPEESTAADPGDIRYRLVDPPLTTPGGDPDQEMLVEVSTSYEYLFGAPPEAGPARIRTYVSVVRLGAAVTLLELRGWEASTTHLEDVQRLSRLATARLAGKG